MAIDVYRSNTRARSIVTIDASIIAQHGNNNPSLSSLVHDILHVLAVRLGVTTAESRVLVLRLIQYDGPAIGDLCFGDC